MSLSSIELWHRISAQGLATPLQCRSWAAEAVQSMDAAEATQGIKLLQRLIECNKLTKYQAKILAGQSEQPLRLNAWVVLEKLKSPVWRDWYAVASSDALANNAAGVTWARQIDQAQLQTLHASAPGLQRATNLASIHHDRLQQAFAPELEAGRLLLRVSPMRGDLLAEKFASDRPTPAESLALLRQIAEALSELHRQGCVHGRVLPDRVYVTTDGPILAVDPLCALTTPVSETLSGVLVSQLGELRAAQFLAPEYLAPGQGPTMAGDIFALGCLWWWLLGGSPPAAGDSVDQILAMQAGKLPELPSDCPLPEPLGLCLKHCLARNLEARFATAVELCAALDVAQQLVSAGKSELSVKPRQSASADSVVPIAAPRSAEPAAPVPPAVADKSHATADVSGPAKPSPERACEAVADKARGAAPSRLVEPTGEKALAASATSTDHQPADRQPTGRSPLLTHPAKVQQRVEPRAARRRRQNRWLVPVVAGCGFLIVLLVALKFSGALKRAPDKRSDNTSVAANYVPKSTPEPELIPPDPRLAFYQIVAAGDRLPWAPPRPPAPMPINLLPPGGQLFIAFHPAELLSSTQQRALLNTFSNEFDPILETLRQQAGVRLESLSQITAAFYAPVSSGQFPLVAMRCVLTEPLSLSTLKTQWQVSSEQETRGQVLLLASQERVYYVAQQPLVDAQSVKEFSVGPLELMREVAELQGSRGPLTLQVEKLWNASDHMSDLTLLISTPFLFTEGRGMFDRSPARLSEILRELAGNEMRAAMVQADFETKPYVEVQLIGANDQDAGKLMAKFESKIRGLPLAIEEWFVSQSPHPYWRALALRYPRMLRTLNEYTRLGVEDGVAIMNAYMPPEATTNILLTSWIALQEGATLAGDFMPASGPTATVQPLSIEEYLARPIRLSFDQEPIEVALRLIGEEANDQLPAGTPQLRFVLDGDAFEKAGITRNQQLSNFKIDQQAMRAALTEVAKRGNPVSVTDTHEENQKLIWVVADDPDSPGNKMVSLTTRAAATAAGLVLPVEFARP